MNDPAWQLEMARPWWLIALIALPPVVFFYWRRSLVQSPQWQQVTSLAIRLVLLVVVIVALCGIRYTRECDEQFVVFVVDRSASISDKANRDAAAFCNEARSHAGDHRSVLLPFSSESAAATASWPERWPESRRASDLAAAIAAAEAVIPGTCVPRIVLLSDGNETTGDARATAKASTVPISTVPLRRGDDPEVYIAAVETQGQVRQAELLDVHVVVESTHDVQATLTLHDSQPGDDPQSLAVRLAQGENRFRFRRSILSEAAVLTARIDAMADTLSENNRAACVVCAPRKIRVLLIEGRHGAAGPLAEILGQQGIDVTTEPLEEMPQRDDALQDFDLLVLANVPAQPTSAAAMGEAAVLKSAQMDLVSRYVANFGGGLIVLGGDQSFTSGDYRGTTLEEILPVQCKIKPDRPVPSRAVVLVVDRSESMRGKNIELLKQATRLATAQLGPRDQAGVIAFEDRSYWVSEILPCSDGQRQRMAQRIGTITAAGGTNMYPAMQRAYRALDETFADLKHMIVLTDGLSHPDDFTALGRRIAAAGITVSTVGVGEEAAGELLQEIAAVGNGRYHDCKDPNAMAKVFSMEAANPPKLGIVEGLVAPQPVDTAEVFADLDFGQVPRLLGYVETLPQENGHLIFTAENGDPLLAWWQYGRGISVAFTSDFQGTWARLWLNWPDRGRFWVELVRHAMRKDPAGGATVRVLRKGERAAAVCLVRLFFSSNVAKGSPFMNTAISSASCVSSRL